MNEEREIVTIEPVTRIEGEGKINILLDDEGEVKDAYFQVLDYRGFEGFLKGRPIEEVPRIATRICGVCSWAHHMASVKAMDKLLGVEPPPAAKKLREIAYNAHIIHSHLLHFFLMASPDFLLSPEANPSTRNIIGLLQKYPEIGKGALRYHAEAEKIQEIISGKAIHPVFAMPGGVSKTITEDERKKVKEKTEEILEFSLKSLEVFKDKVVNNEKYADLFSGELYSLETYHMGMVDEKEQINFYDGNFKVIDPTGKEATKFQPSEYLEYIAERSQPWSYTKFPYLKKIGWNGFKEGEESGVFRVNAISRLNVSEGMPTEKAQDAYEEFIEKLGYPVHSAFAYNWGRLIESIYCCERNLELLEDPVIIEGTPMNRNKDFQGRGVGIVEAPRGSLIHHYEADKNGKVTTSNLVIPTTMNNAAISMDIKNAASKLIRNGNISEGILNRVEMAYRNYDPCLSCSTHSLPGKAPIELIIRNNDGKIIERIRRRTE
ncbi:MAG: Ni/Fe hydrogenase subunit alpha [Candidatus Korarchaeota archaeon]|nr:Ni/Fe hydrogenase subunit alpha [Candidatus Korarchaeota archaeon]NIU84506.1 Ni/Fe hydrogenase subunit alpha [Candidatus Thorarchaeota archaeon]NIW14573.1 Ni/Fe hydrogenase subunit alpha [Candidatus Thorarchaeota archaeon]NIW52645.1 Ni/Fe hydrogenase subunit alpha [Candidatus Korarchaeota archaeon]